MICSSHEVYNTYLVQLLIFIIIYTSVTFLSVAVSLPRELCERCKVTNKSHLNIFDRSDMRVYKKLFVKIHTEKYLLPASLHAAINESGRTEQISVWKFGCLS